MLTREGAQPYLGREQQLERLVDALGDAAAGRGSMAVVRGQAGGGVSATLREVAARATGQGFQVLWGACREGIGGRPYEALAEALDGHARSAGPAALYAELGDGAPVLARLAPQVRAKLPAVPPPAPLDASAEMLRVTESVLGWLLRTAAEQPLLIVLDDLQWAGRDLARLLEQLLPQLHAAAVLVLAGWADYPAGAQQAQAPPEGVRTVVELAGLDEGATGALLARHADAPLSGAALGLLQQVSAGHPLTAVELYRHLREEGSVGRPGGDALATPGSLPQTIEDIVAWRLARLSLEERTVLGALACFPRAVSAGPIAAVSGLARPRTVDALERSVAHGLVSSPEMTAIYEIGHPRIARALVASLSAGVRAEALGKVAEALESELGADARQQAPMIAELYGRTIRGRTGPNARLSVERARAGLRHALVAAEQARSASAFDRAAECIALGFALADAGGQADGELRLRVALAMAEADRPSDAVPEVRQGAALSTRPAELELVVATARALLDHGRRDAADEVLAVTGRAAETDDRLAARLELLAAHWRPVEHGRVKALVWHESGGEAERVLLRDGDEQDRSELFLAQRSRSHEQTVTLLNLARSWRGPASLLRALHGASVDLLTRLGQLREASSWSAEYVAAAERYGSPLDIVRARLLLAQGQAALGELGAASESLAEAAVLEARLAPAARPAVERLCAELAVAHYLDGDWAALLARAEAAAAQPTPAGPLLVAEAALATGRAGDTSPALPLIEDVLGIVAEWPPLAYLRDSAMLVALTAAWEAGRAEHAARGRALLELAVAAGVGGNHAATPGLAMARMHGLGGQLDEAAALFASQREALEGAGQRPLRAIVDHDEAIVLAAAGAAGHSDAARLLGEAAAAFEGLGMAGWRARAERLLEIGFETASQPGGRLHFSYPAGLSRREAELVRGLAGGAGLAEVAARLELDPASADRHLASAMEKLGASDTGELPALARRHGLGGGV